MVVSLMRRRFLTGFLSSGRLWVGELPSRVQDSQRTAWLPLQVTVRPRFACRLASCDSFGLIWDLFLRQCRQHFCGFYAPLVEIDRVAVQGAHSVISFDFFDSSSIGISKKFPKDASANALPPRLLTRLSSTSECVVRLPVSDSQCRCQMCFESS